MCFYVKGEGHIVSNGCRGSGSFCLGARCEMQSPTFFFGMLGWKRAFFNYTVEHASNHQSSPHHLLGCKTFKKSNVPVV